MKDFLDKAKVASRIIATLSPQTKIDVLHAMAQSLEQNSARIIEENQKTRDLIQNNYIEGLRTALSDAKAEISNRDQTSSILNTMGRWHGYPSCGCGMGCTTYSQNLI